MQYNSIISTTVNFKGIKICIYTYVFYLILNKIDLDFLNMKFCSYILLVTQFENIEIFKYLLQLMINSFVILLLVYENFFVQ